MPKLSLCMIVKNEEACLDACLHAAQGFVDEIIIVDTGSTDKTKEIAQKFTNKIFDFPWQDDFSAARNFSLEKATGDWILVLDADEIIAQEDHQKIRTLITKQESDILAYFLHQREYTNDTTLTGFQYISSKEKDKYSKRFLGFVTVANAIRLFQNKSEIKFNWKIHESIAEALEKQQIVPEESEIAIHHYKNEKGTAVQHDKMLKYLHLGEEQIRLTPNHPKPYYEVGLIYYALGRYQEAAAAFQKALALGVREPQRVYHKLGRCFAQLKNYPEAIKTYQQALSFGKDSDISAQLGILYAKLQQFGAAEQYFLQALEVNPANILARHNLSVLSFQQGKKEAAKELLEETEQHYPNPFTYNILGILAAQEKKYTVAKEYFQKALALTPSSSAIAQDISKNLIQLEKEIEKIK